MLCWIHDGHQKLYADWGCGSGATALALSAISRDLTSSMAKVYEATKWLDAVGTSPTMRAIEATQRAKAKQVASFRWAHEPVQAMLAKIAAQAPTPSLRLERELPAPVMPARRSKLDPAAELSVDIRVQLQTPVQVTPLLDALVRALADVVGSPSSKRERHLRSVPPLKEEDAPEE